MTNWNFTFIFLAIFMAVDVGGSNSDAEKGKASGSPIRSKKRQLKSNDAGDAWGKLLSQCSQVCV